jgi:hypothetical protein
MMTNKLEMSLENFAKAVAKENSHLSIRIEQLEAALTHIYAWYPVSVSDPAQTIKDIREFARNALEGENESN